MQNIRNKITEHQLRIDEAKTKLKMRARNQLEALKLKLKKDVTARIEDSIKIV